MVQAQFMGTKLLSWKCWTWLGRASITSRLLAYEVRSIVEKYIAGQDKKSKG